MPKEVSAAQTALRQHNDARNKLQQLINFTSDEADQIIIRVRQQVLSCTIMLMDLLFIVSVCLYISKPTDQQPLFH